MDVDYKLVGERIKDARKKKGWTQEKLSEEVDVTVVYISRVERGSCQINLKRLAQISRVLGVTMEYLLEGAVANTNNYLDKDLYNILVNCTPAKQRLIYEIAQMVCEAEITL